MLSVAAVAFLLLSEPLGFARSDDPLLGEAYGDVAAGHVPEGSLTDALSRPPAGGPHYPRPWPTGVYEEAINDGFLIHSLEHGMIWLAYQPELLDPEGLGGLAALAAEYRHDVILAPRPANDAALYAMSWGRRLEVNPGDLGLLREFIETNRNRSPEPGIR